MPLLKRIRAWLESVINHLVVVGILSLLADQYLKPNGKCPTTLFYESIHDPYINGDNIRLEHGITYRMPPEGILYIGGSLAVLGVGMLLFGLKMQQTISAVATIAGAAFLAEELAMRSLLLIPKEDRYTLVTDLNQGPLTKHRFNVDVSCASSIFATLIAIAAALNLVAMYIFKRAANFFEGAVCAVLIVRLAAQFVPWLLMVRARRAPDCLPRLPHLSIFVAARCADASSRRPRLPRPLLRGLPARALLGLRRPSCLRHRSLQLQRAHASRGHHLSGRFCCHQGAPTDCCPSLLARARRSAPAHSPSRVHECRVSR